ncbi:MAG TPA: hypothetical protein VJ110_02600 [Candidatus Nanoarchaeia archaeon]|nr:hypothetical protein [Candidatus Nanoarchaeia archaeon]
MVWKTVEENHFGAKSDLEVKLNKTKEDTLKEGYALSHVDRDTWPNQDIFYFVYTKTEEPEVKLLTAQLHRRQNKYSLLVNQGSMEDFKAARGFIWRNYQGRQGIEKQLAELKKAKEQN